MRIRKFINKLILGVDIIGLLCLVLAVVYCQADKAKMGSSQSATKANSIKGGASSVALQALDVLPRVKNLADLKVNSASIVCDLWAGLYASVCLPQVVFTAAEDDQTYGSDLTHVSDTFYITICSTSNPTDCASKHRAQRSLTFKLRPIAGQVASVAGCVGEKRAPDPTIQPTFVSKDGAKYFCGPATKSPTTDNFDNSGQLNANDMLPLFQADEQASQNTDDAAQAFYGQVQSTVAGCQKDVKSSPLCTDKSYPVLVTWANLAPDKFVGLVEDMAAQPDSYLAVANSIQSAMQGTSKSVSTAGQPLALLGTERNCQGYTETWEATWTRTDWTQTTVIIPAGSKLGDGTIAANDITKENFDPVYVPTETETATWTVPDCVLQTTAQTQQADATKVGKTKTQYMALGVGLEGLGIALIIGGYKLKNAPLNKFNRRYLTNGLSPFSGEGYMSAMRKYYGAGRPFPPNFTPEEEQFSDFLQNNFKTFDQVTIAMGGNANWITSRLWEEKEILRGQVEVAITKREGWWTQLREAQADYDRLATIKNQNAGIFANAADQDEFEAARGAISAANAGVREINAQLVSLQRQNDLAPDKYKLPANRDGTFHYPTEVRGDISIADFAHQSWLGSDEETTARNYITDIKETLQRGATANLGSEVPDYLKNVFDRQKTDYLNKKMSKAAEYGGWGVMGLGVSSGIAGLATFVVGYKASNPSSLSLADAPSQTVVGLLQQGMGNVYNAVLQSKATYVVAGMSAMIGPPPTQPAGNGTKP